mgnify:FL=1
MKSYFVFLKRNKLYTAIQAFGLSVALGFVILLASHVRTEFTVGTTQSMAKELYIAGGENTVGMRAKTAPDIFPNVPQIKGWTRAGTNSSCEYSVEGEMVKLSMMEVDTNFFQFFDYKLVGLDRKKVLPAEDEIIVSESFVRKYFPDEDPIGKTIRQFGTRSKTIVGIVEDFDKDDIFEPVDILESVLPNEKAGWVRTGTTYGYTCNFITLAEGAKIEEVEEALLDRYVNTYDVWSREHSDNTAFYGSKLTRLDKFYFQNTLQTTLRTGNRTNTIFLMVVALILLVSAVFNYVNLTVALVGKRAKEIATRRLLGDQVTDVVMRSLTESFLFTSICFALGCMLAILLRTWFAQLLNAQIYFPLDGISISSALITMILVALISGIIPAALVSHFKPIDVIKGSFCLQNKTKLNNVLIVLQNLISTALIAVGLTMSIQMHHVSNLPMGYNKDRMLEVNLYPVIGSDSYAPILKDRLQQMPQVKSVGWSWFMPYICNTIAVQDESKDFVEEAEQSWVNICIHDTAVIRMLGYEILEQYTTDTDGKYWVTEEARDFYGISAERPYFGKKLEISKWNSRAWDYEVCGVIKDFVTIDPINGPNVSNAHNIVGVTNSSRHYFLMIIELTDDAWNDIKATKEAINDVCTQFGHEFLNKEVTIPIHTIQESIEIPMRQQNNTKKLIICFMSLSVLISVLGQFAMSISYTQRQSKSIAVRKVMGATVPQAVWELSRPFVQLAMLASVLAMPIAIWQINDYLNDFYFRIDFPWWLLLLSMFFTVIISLVSILWQTYKVANQNPIKSIRTE